MGKGKAKKSKTGEISPDHINGNSAQPPLCTCGHSHEPLKASDGHNVDGWTDEDIRIYNELLNERAKLEKEKNELEQKSARHQAERALLNEDAAAFDNLFKVQLTGEYKFTGTSSCCLDFAPNASGPRSRCHHEICTRSKRGGVSWMEMDTIKYYQARISTERSQRMKSALRKQRDVELERVKKDDEEELAMRNRRSAHLDKAQRKGEIPLSSKRPLAQPPLPTVGIEGSSQSPLDPNDSEIVEAATENENLIRNIRTKLDSIRRDVQAGKVSAFDARVKLDQANKEMAEAERKNHAFKDMIFTKDMLFPSNNSQDFIQQSTTLSQALSKSLAHPSKDAFSQALNVMKSFFSASDPHDVQAAMTDLRKAIELEGVTPQNLSKSFNALEDILKPPDPNEFSVDLRNEDGTILTSSDIDRLFNELSRAPTDKELVKLAKALQVPTKWVEPIKAAVRVQHEAMDAVVAWLAANKHESFRKAKIECDKIVEAALERSMMRPMTQCLLPPQVSATVFKQGARNLLANTLGNEKPEAIQAQITGFILAAANDKHEYIMSALKSLKQFMADTPDNTRAEFTDFELAFEEVQKKLKVRVAKKLEEIEISAATNEASSSLRPAPLDLAKSHEDLKTHSSPSINEDQPNILDCLYSDLRRLMFEVEDSSERMKELDDVTHDVTKDMKASDRRNVKKAVRKLLALTSPDNEDEIGRRVHHIGELCFKGNPVLRDDIMQNQRYKEVSNERHLAEQNRDARLSKFQEELALMASAATKELDKDLAAHSPSPGDDKSNPPPYIANEGRARSAVKVGHVPVGSPSVIDDSAIPAASVPVPPPSLPVPGAGVIRTATGETFAAGADGIEAARAITERQNIIFTQLHMMWQSLLKVEEGPPATLGQSGYGLDLSVLGVQRALRDQFYIQVGVARSVARANRWPNMLARLEEEYPLAPVYGDEDRE
jgi:hypothetical protein